MEAKIDEVGKLGPGWEFASWRLRTLTVIWAGGIEKGQCAKEMKSTTLMGSLRYWAEMVCRENGEPVCDGEKWCGAGTCPVCGVFGSTEIERAFRIRITGLKHDESQGGLWGDDFRIEIWTKIGDRRGERGKRLVGSAIGLMAQKGGFGARTQRGWGQVELLGG